MNLDEGQRKKVADWIQQGLKLSEIQNRIGSEFGLRLTYMDVRFLVDDLKLVPKDPEPAPAATPKLPSAPAAAAPSPAGAAGALGKVSVQVDSITRPGAVVSGKVVFTDGKDAEWYLDQTGRLGFIPRETGYRPPAADLQQFQAALDAELGKLGF
ncbi:MAG TPA: hypothetical protein VHH88_13940 [Verrucomicrobiae bacterium]|nr:hypothetical protein [Verrucomicrobiae bacterium]